MYKKINYNNIMDEYVKNKSIVLVGPSSKLIGTNMGGFIDNHDIVIRMKQSLLQYPFTKELERDIGGRFDIFYTCTYYSPKCQKSDFLKYIVMQYNSGHPKTDDRVILSIDNYDKLLKMIEKEGIIPSTGLFAIYDILQYEIKELTIIGFDFYKNDNIFTKYTKYMECHNREEEERIFNKIKDDRVNFI